MNDARPVEPAWDPAFQPLGELFVGRHGVKTRNAIEVGKRAVEYARGKDICKWIMAHVDQISSKAPKSVAGISNWPNVSTTEALQLGEELLKRHFIQRMEHAPLAEGAPAGGTRAEPKWPNRLRACQSQQFEKSGFYVIRYESNSATNKVLLGGIISVVLFFCMFPAWPLKMKIVSWYISVVLLTLILILVVVRLVAFVLLWFCGCDFWIYPNLFADDAGVIDSFIPMYSFKYREDDWIMVGARVFCAILLTAGIFKLGETHSIADIGNFAEQQFLDVLDWGYQKLTEDPSTAITATGKTGGDAIAENPFLDGSGIDFTCMKKCNFASFTELKEECLTDCDCARELLGSTCLPKCSIEAQEAITKSATTICEAVAEEELEVPQSTADDDEIEDYEDDDESEVVETNDLFGDATNSVKEDL